MFVYYLEASIPIYVYRRKYWNEGEGSLASIINNAVSVLVRVVESQKKSKRRNDRCTADTHPSET